MKIGIPASGNNLEAKVDSRYARAPYIIIVDSDNLEYEAVENRNMNSQQGAGTGMSQDLIKNGADIVISQNVGPKAWDVLKEFEVKVYKAEEGMTVKEAVELFKEGKLSEITTPTESHDHHHHH